MRGATHALIAILDSNIYFNPRTPRGVRRSSLARPQRPTRFQSTHPSRGATADKATERLRHEISIHAPHAGRDNSTGDVYDNCEISIHAPHAGRDNSTGDVYDNCEISIHAPHAGRDVILNPIPQEVALFQSTRPMRGATISLTLRRSAALYFNPRAPCGRDRWPSPAPTSTENFNPRAPCGRDCSTSFLLLLAFGFQSTRPVRARLRYRMACGSSSPFQSTRPVRARPPRRPAAESPVGFQSTRPVRARRYRTHWPRSLRIYFNPRAPCGRDLLTSLCRVEMVHFNPRAPCGRDF